MTSLVAAAMAVITLQVPCTGAIDSLIEHGWERYRAGQPDSAQVAFSRARRACPDNLGARVGLGYTALRADERVVASEWFEDVLGRDSSNVDAQVGLGLIAWRNGDLAAVRTLFERVAALDPDRPEAREYLARLPDGVGVAPTRPPLQLPDTVEHYVRTDDDYFQIRTSTGWRRFYIKGVNLGAALPGKHPSQFPDSATYGAWLADIGEMGANVLRLYTVHPPHFYGALAAYNRAHPDRQLWLMHGVWAELPPQNNFDDPAWKGEFLAEMRRAVDLLHGRADIAPRPGHASGFYTVDVSRWVLGYIIGREWEPYAVREFNRDHAGSDSWAGRYLVVDDATPMDAWLAEVCEAMTAYETETYRAQRPIAYTNWPTLDPLPHPTETTAEEEVAIRVALGEYDVVSPREYDNDAEALNPMLVRVTPHFRAGFFAAYHAYPYYPDFMILDGAYRTARSSLGPSNYFGYLRDLKARHAGMPVVIAEYGVPASLGNAHLQPQGWHHGGHDERAMADIDVRMTQEIAEAGMAGGVIFAWIDEWFKKNWLVIDFEIPLDRNRLWINRLDAEQHYGMIAIEPGEILPGVTLTDRLRAWHAVRPLYDTPDGRIRAAADEANLWILFEGVRDRDVERYIGFDMVGPSEGAFHWPGSAAPEMPVGIEFVLRASPTAVRLLAAPGANPFRIVQLEETGGATTVAPTSAPPGFVAGSYAQEYSRRIVADSTRHGEFEPLRVITNRRRIGRDTTEYAAMGYDRGTLPGGAPPDGYWEWDEVSGALEVRIPWLLLNVTDPSSRRVLHGDASNGFQTTTVDGIHLTAAARRRDGSWVQWPRSGARADVASFSWEGWEEPTWRARRRPVYHAMRRLFETMDTSMDYVPAADGRAR